MALLGATGLASYLVALTVTAPASLVLPRSSGAIATGTVWNGEAALPGGDRLTWRWSPLRSLVQFGFAAGWTIRGSRTELAGDAVMQPGAVRVSRVTGTVSALTLTSLARKLPFACDMVLAVRLPQVALGGPRQAIVGSVRSQRGSCWAKAVTGAATSVPALAFRAEDLGARGTRMWVAPLVGVRRDLVVATLSRTGGLTLEITAEGAAILPFASPPGGLKLEM